MQIFEVMVSIEASMIRIMKNLEIMKSGKGKREIKNI
jgi:hypothetical protein